MELGKMTKEQQELAEKNMKLVHYAIHKFNIDPEYEGDGYFALCKAAMNYDPNEGTTFATYALKVILNEMRYQYRKRDKLNPISLNDVLSTTGDGDELEIMDIVQDKSDFDTDVLELNTIQDKLNRLITTDLYIVYLKLRGFKQVEIADQIGVHRFTVSKYLKNIYDFIKIGTRYSRRQEVEWVVANVDREEILQKVHKALKDVIGVDSFYKSIEPKLKNAEDKNKALEQIREIKDGIINKGKEEDTGDIDTTSPVVEDNQPEEEDTEICTGRPLRKVVCPGSFDPITLGHIDIIKRASIMFDKVIVAIGNNPAKKYTFTVDERKKLIRKSLEDIPNIEVDYFDGLLSDYIRKKKAIGVVKGIRESTDFNYEFQMAITNKQLNHDFETVLLPTNLEYLYLSSSVVRQVAKANGDISKFVHNSIVEDIKSKFRNSDA